MTSNDRPRSFAEATASPLGVANPDYGSGVYRRRIKLDGQPGRVVAELEDCNHGFRSTVFHDGERVTDIQAEALRIPLTSCPGAVEPIKALIGTALGTSSLAISRTVSPQANCTHLYDLTLLAIQHCQRGLSERVYDVVIDDENEDGGDSLSRVWRDGEPLFRWSTRQWQIQAPATVAGRPLFRGFAAWANEQFSGDEQEAAFVLQKGYFVAQARRYDIDAVAGEPASNHSTMIGACYSYSSPQVDSAVRTASTTRDFTDCPEQLLKFI